MIKLLNISKSYGEILVIDDANLEVKKGEFIAIVGNSGSGKSTILNILGFLDNQASGNYFFENKNSLDFSEKQKAYIRNKKIGFVFQDYCLMPNMSVYENVKMPFKYFKEKKNNENKIDEILSNLSIIKLKDKLTQNLSGGEKQRVAIARALINNPELLICDEPTGNLDSKMTIEIFDILKKLNDSGITIILVTHNNLIANLCKKKYVLENGKLNLSL